MDILNKTTRWSNQHDMIAGSKSNRSRFRILLPAYLRAVLNKEPRGGGLLILMAMMMQRTRGEDPLLRLKLLRDREQTTLLRGDEEDFSLMGSTAEQTEQKETLGMGGNRS